MTSVVILGVKSPRKEVICAVHVCSVAKSCLILCDPMDCSSSVHGISQGRILEWVAISFSRGYSWPRDQIANICWIREKARKFQKNIYLCFIDYAKAFDCVDHNRLWKILKRLEYQTTLPASWEICMQVRKQQLELDMEQQTGSK